MNSDQMHHHQNHHHHQHHHLEPEYKQESTLLQTVNQLITKYRNDPNYKVGKSKLGLKGKTIAELKKIRDGIKEKRRVTKESHFSKRLQEGKQRLKSTPLPEKREIPPTLLKKNQEPKTCF